MNHRYHFVGSALLSRTSMDITHQQESEKMFEGCESRVNNLHYIHISQRLWHSRFVGNHLLIIGLVF
jgi:hypothetical protein